MHSSSSPLPPGGPSASPASLAGVTAAAAAACASAMVRVAQDCFIALDAAGAVVEFNPAAERTTGFSRAEALGRPITDLLVPLSEQNPQPGDPPHPLSRAHLARLAEPGGEPAPGRRLEPTEARLLRRNGTGFPAELTLCPLARDPATAGSALCGPAFVLCLRDISERKLLEAQFLRAQRLESIGTLASGIAHDLNNILAPMLMAVNLLEEARPNGTGSRLLGTLRSGIQRGAEMVKQIVCFTRGENGVRSRVQLRHLVTEILRIAVETFPRKVHIKTEIPRGLWLVQGDSTQLHQVLMNLCVNARDAMPQGGTLLIQAQNIQLGPGSAELPPGHAPGLYVVLQVSDTGAGIPAELLPRIWEPFFTTKPAGEGTGLGLRTVLTIVEAHHGFIHTSSIPGEGSRFSIYLPAIEASSQTSLVEKERPPAPGRGEQILIIDDEPAFQEITKAILERYGYRVLTASDGTEGLALFARNLGQVDLVMTDMVMPFLDGSATITALRSVDPHVRVLATSGLTETEQSVTDGQTTRFLSKPFTTERLLTTIHDMLHPGAPPATHPPPGPGPTAATGLGYAREQAGPFASSACRTSTPAVNPKLAP